MDERGHLFDWLDAILKEIHAQRLELGSCYRRVQILSFEKGIYFH